MRLGESDALIILEELDRARLETVRSRLSGRAHAPDVGSHPRHAARLTLNPRLPAARSRLLFSRPSSLAPCLPPPSQIRNMPAFITGMVKRHQSERF
jgi:hypothetical protein